ncbi:MAG: hypothetical protein MZV70_63660 [Desulfobacterales bacterium]|nr:hypothetical protein [Desulfobacterales bacterium]
MLARHARRGAPARAPAATHCVGDVPMAARLPPEEVDEVHTLTSLAGFEALLRGKRVVAYGQPFYAGWGLTTDFLPPRARRRCDGGSAGGGGADSLSLLCQRHDRAVRFPERVLAELNAGRNLGRQPRPWLRPFGGARTVPASCGRCRRRHVVGVGADPAGH